ncbi:unnamed protein product [Arctia plantaginis]|uniref:Uncharacterized protein n=1 Tax=Arctia plantaginis TaxID=874455 RepID=A0A8S1B762_ARCPL|nr:unnamed protein product [Arctia plantaginis]
MNVLYTAVIIATSNSAFQIQAPAQFGNQYRYILDLCIEKRTKTKAATAIKDPTIKLDDTANAVLEADYLDSLLKQFEAIELNTKKRSEPVVNVEDSKKNNYNHCSPKKLHSDLKKSQSLSNKLIVKVNKYDNIGFKNKISGKRSAESPAQSKSCEKLSSPRSTSVKNEVLDLNLKKKRDNFVILSACNTNDDCNQNYKGSLKIIIRNQSQVVLNCDSQKDPKSLEHKTEKRPFDDKVNKCMEESIQNKLINIKRIKSNIQENTDRVTINIENQKDKIIKELDGKPRTEKKVHIPKPNLIKLKAKKRPYGGELNRYMEATTTKIQPPVKKKKT